MQWTAPIIFIVVIGGIGTLEGPIIGAVLYYFLRDYFNDHETAYIIGTGVVAMVVALWVQPGIWGHIQAAPRRRPVPAPKTTGTGLARSTMMGRTTMMER